MQNTHITEQHKTRSTSNKISLSLLAIFFLFVLWGANPSQAMMLSKQKQQNAIQLQEEADNKDKSYFKQGLDHLNKHKKYLLAGAGVTAVASVVVFVWSSYTNAPQSTSINTQRTGINTQASQPVAAEKSFNKNAIAQMASNEAGWFDPVDDVATSIKAIFEIARSTVSKVTGPTAVQAVTTVAPGTSALAPASASASSTAAAEKDNNLITTIAKKAYSLLIEHPRATLLSTAAIGVGLWWKLTGKKPSARTVKDWAAGWFLAPWLSKAFLASTMAPLFNVCAGPAAFVGRLFFQDTQADLFIKGQVEEGCKRVLPNRDTVKNVVKKIVPSMLGKDKLEAFILGNWGSSSGDDGNNSDGAAKLIGTWSSDLVGGAFGLLILLIIFKFYEWYQKATNYTHEEKKAPQVNDEQEQKNKKATTDLGDSLFLHIISSLGMADIAYTLVDKVIKVLEQKAEKYTQHQRYKPKSKIQEIKAKTKKRLELLFLN